MTEWTTAPTPTAAKPAHPSAAPRILRPLVRVLLVPLLLAAVATASVGGPGWIRIKRGDTLSELAVKYGTSVQALRELNDLPGNNLIIAGQWLRVGRVPVVTKSSPRPARRTVVTYMVRPGDGLIRIANRYGTDWRWIAKRNRVGSSLVIHPGQRLVVKEGFTRAPAARAARGTTHTVTKAYARQVIEREARRQGVDVPLALALAYNESGFQQHVTSSVGAIGVMQVMPGTGEWVAKYLVGRPLNLRDLEDNVLAGIRYFKQLLRITGRWDMALAGYYQGLASVRQRGMYDDTTAYIRNILALRSRFGG
ncbi:MAG TPA: LysM peptidoglycan-binding domain-containing protein [Frankiaceae bacterium]|nr:LysM peptidoglycan-binding domain-containing protein [Frankiaceae bacterium]